MAEDRFIPRGDIDWKDALVITAFPTTGMAASIAAQYLRKELELPLVGSILIDGQDSIVAVQDGIATPPVRVFGGDAKCDIRLHGECHDVFIVTADLVLDMPLLRRIAALVLQKAKADGAHMVLALEGVNRSEDDQTPDVYLAAGSEAVLEELADLEVSRAAQAMLGGMTGELLLDASVNGHRVGALLVEASPQHPDGRAAAALLHVLDRLIPHVKVDPGPLEEKAMEMEEAIKQAQAKAQQAQPGPPHSTFI